MCLKNLDKGEIIKAPGKFILKRFKNNWKKLLLAKHKSMKAEQIRNQKSLQIIEKIIDIEAHTLDIQNLLDIFID